MKSKIVRTDHDALAALAKRVREDRMPWATTGNDQGSREIIARLIERAHTAAVYDIVYDEIRVHQQCDNWLKAQVLCEVLNTYCEAVGDKRRLQG